MQSDRYQGRFPGYTGKKLFEVEHPVFGRCTVAAPDENAALLPAASTVPPVMAMVPSASRGCCLRRPSGTRSGEGRSSTHTRR